VELLYAYDQAVFEKDISCALRGKEISCDEDMYEQQRELL
jgi:hypothetical protein